MEDAPGALRDDRRWHQRLQALRESLQQDGYDLGVAVSDGGAVTVNVTARPDACDDCLVPKSVFRALVVDAWSQAGGPVVDPEIVDVVYPGEAPAARTCDGSADARAATPLASAVHVVDDWADAQRLAHERGWTDGLPIVPPTPDRVRAHVDALAMRPDDVVAQMPERNAVITAEGLSVNAVLAGARPEHMAVLRAAVEAVADPEFKFNHLASLGSPWPLLLLSGPVVADLGLHGEHYLFGPDAGCNAVISRAFSLTLRNLASAGNDGIQRGQWGNPIRWQCLVSEAVDSPWPSLAVRHGHGEGTSVLMAISVFPSVPLQVMTLDPRPERVLDAVCHSMTGYGGAQWTVGTYVLMLNPHQADAFAREGWDAEEVAGYVMDHTKTTVADLKLRGAWGATRDEAPALVQQVQPDDWHRDVYLFRDNGETDEWLLTRSAVEGRVRTVEVVVTGGDAGVRPAVAVPYMVSSNPVLKTVRPAEHEET